MKPRIAGPDTIRASLDKARSDLEKAEKKTHPILKCIHGDRQNQEELIAQAKRTIKTLEHLLRIWETSQQRISHKG